MSQRKITDPATNVTNTAPDTKPGALSDDLKAASQAVMSALAEKRAKRRAAWAMGEVPRVEKPSIPPPIVAVVAPKPASIQNQVPSVAETAKITEHVAARIPILTDVIADPKGVVITPEIRARVESMRREIDQLLPDLQSNTTPLTADEIIESVANMQAQEKDWERLSISEIRIPKQEVSLWGGFLKILNQGITERASNREFGKWDIYELRIPKFKFFYITRIRQSEKDGLTCAIVQSQINGMDQSYTIEVLVRLPVREGGMLEIYRNRPEGVSLINKWKVEQVFIRKNPEERKKKGWLFKLLGI